MWRIFLCVTFPLESCAIIPAAANWSAVIQTLRLSGEKESAVIFFFPCVAYIQYTSCYSGLSWRGQTWATAPVAKTPWPPFSCRLTRTKHPVQANLDCLHLCNIITAFMAMATFFFFFFFFNLMICELICKNQTLMMFPELSFRLLPFYWWWWFKGKRKCTSSCFQASVMIYCMISL